MRVDFLDKMGDDNAVVDAARVSFSKVAAYYTPKQNAKLIHYLARNGHWTPFAHVIFKFRFSAPIAIHAQCMKHQIGFVMNTESRRYVSYKPVYYVPIFRNKPDGSIKQGSGGDHERNSELQMDYISCMDQALQVYDELIEAGVAPEQARFILPQGVITQWVWTGSLVAWARFYKQRIDGCAQQEIQILAEKVHYLIKDRCPIAWAALTESTNV